MSQYQVRTGPIQNDAATFQPAMVQGNAPARSRASQGPRIGLPAFIDVSAFAFESILAGNLDKRSHLTKPQHVQVSLSQPTHVAAPVMVSMTTPNLSGVPNPRFGQSVSVFAQDFAFDSVLASRLDARYRLTKPQHLPPIAQTTHVAAALDSVMVAGTQGQTYPSPRILLGQRIPLPLSQTTHVTAGIDQPMVDGEQPSRPRISFGRQPGQQSSVLAVDFAFETVLASQLDSRRHLTYPQHWNALFQSTHVSAALDVPMVAGNAPPLPRILRPRQLGQPTWLEVLAFSFDSVLGSRLDARNHLTYPQHLAPFSQPTHVSAPFGQEMVSRALDWRSRQTKPQQNSQLDFIFFGAFPFESVLGSRLDSRNHLWRSPQIGQPVPQQQPGFSFESVLGSRLDYRNHIERGKVSGLIVLPSFLDFAFESILGSRLDYRNHLGRALQIGQPVPPQQAGFQFESVIASRLDYRNHLRNPIHIQPIAQPTHVQAPITLDMFKGWNSIPPQLKNTGIFLFYYATGENLGVFVATVGPINNPGAIGIGDLGAKGIGERGASGIGDLGAEPGSSGRGAISRSGIRKIKKTP